MTWFPGENTHPSVGCKCAFEAFPFYGARSTDRSMTPHVRGATRNTKLSKRIEPYCHTSFPRRNLDTDKVQKHIPSCEKLPPSKQQIPRQYCHFYSKPQHDLELFHCAFNPALSKTHRHSYGDELFYILIFLFFRLCRYGTFTACAHLC
ncbi:unnamed protein product [Ectocarpus sp. 4 AP-2014]